MAIVLDGERRARLHAALLAAFERGDLERLVSFTFNQRLDDITGPGSVSNVAHALIQWAEKEEQVGALIHAMVRARPLNTRVAALAQELSGGAAPATGQLDGPRLQRLREALVALFPNRGELAILVNDALSQNLDALAADANLTTAVFQLLSWANIDPAGRLRPLVQAAARARPNSAELQALVRELQAS